MASLQSELESHKGEIESLRKKVEKLTAAKSDFQSQQDKSAALEKRVKELEADLSRASKAAKDLVVAVERSLPATN